MALSTDRDIDLRSEEADDPNAAVRDPTAAQLLDGLRQCCPVLAP